MASGRQFGRTAVIALGFQGISMILSMSWVYMVSHMLGVAATGQTFVALAVVNSAIAIVSLGLAHAIPVRSRDWDDITLVSNAGACATVIGLLAAATLWLLPIEALHITALQHSGVDLLPAIVFFYFVQIMGTVTLRAVGRFTLANWGNISVFGLFNLLLLAGWLTGRAVPSASAVILIFLVACLGGALLVTLFLLSSTGFAAATIRRKHVRQLLTFGGSVHVGNVLKEAMYRADLYIVGWLLGPIAAGLYGVVLRVIEAIARFVDAIGVIAIPMIVRGTEKEREYITYLSLIVSVPLMALAAIVGSLFAPWIVSLLFGAAFMSATGLLRIGVFSLIPLTIWKILANDIIARGMGATYILSALVGAVTITALDLALIRPIGVVAAPIVLNIAYLLPALVLAIVAIKRVGYHLQGIAATFRNLATRRTRPCRAA